MPNKAINQLPLATDRQPDDVFYVVRSGADRSIPSSALAPQVFVAITTIDSADVLTSNATPVEVVPAPASSKVIIPLFALLRFEGGTTNYATNTDVRIKAEGAAVQGPLTGSIADRTRVVMMLPQVTGDAVAGAPLLFQTITGNPVTGDSDLVIETYYHLVDA